MLINFYRNIDINLCKKKTHNMKCCVEITGLVHCMYKMVVKYFTSNIR